MKITSENIKNRIDKQRNKIPNLISLAVITPKFSNFRLFWHCTCFGPYFHKCTMIGGLFTGNFCVGGTKLRLGIACNSWLQKIEIIGQIGWQWELHVWPIFRRPGGGPPWVLWRSIKPLYNHWLIFPLTTLSHLTYLVLTVSGPPVYLHP